MNIILLYSEHGHVSSTHVTIFSVVIKNTNMFIASWNCSWSSHIASLLSTPVFSWHQLAVLRLAFFLCRVLWLVYCYILLPSICYFFVFYKSFSFFWFNNSIFYFGLSKKLSNKDVWLFSISSIKLVFSFFTLLSKPFFFTFLSLSIEIRVWDAEHNKYIRIKIKQETWIAKQFIATYVRNLNYKTTCFGLWRPSSGPDSGILKQEKSLGG